MGHGRHDDLTGDTRGGAGRFGPQLAVAAAAFLSVTLIAAASGGYHPDAWGWIVLGFGWMGALALVLRRQISLGILDIAACTALGLLTAWIGASIAWSDDVPQSVFELERALVYLVGLLAVLVAVRRRSLPWFVGGLLAGIVAVCVAALLSRLFPSEGIGSDVILVNRLSDPIGYWNALGIFAGMGALMALGVAAHGSRVAGRVAAAAALPVLLTTLYFTYSRGSWIALAIGAAAAVAIDPRRLELVTAGLLLAPASAIAVAVSSGSEALTRLRAPHDQIVDDGRKLALLLLGMVVVSACIALVTSMGERHVHLRPTVRRAYGGVLAGVVVVGLAAVLVHFGGPVTMAEDAYSSFKDQNPAPASSGAPGDLNRRLFTLRSNGRIDYWEASWHQNQARPLLGQGAGSFEQYWLRERTFPSQVRDAHGLYAEFLGEGGWIGLGLLLLTLGLPLLAGLRARGDAFVPGAFGALTAYVAHAGVDWDWEVPAVTLVALSFGAVLLISARGRPSRPLAVRMPVRVALVAALLAIAAFSGVGLLGNRALGRAEAAADGARWDDAAREARAAKRWAPWSGAAWRDLGKAQLGLGRPGEARASLQKAVRKDPSDWRGWYYLGTASRGGERLRAYRRAERLNPFAEDIRPLRKRYHLPKPPEPTR
jgi:tetratricopeptide (TPR) repeat protein